MREMLGYCSGHLCWPEGYYNQDYIHLAEELGFAYLYTTERRMNSPRHDALRIGRISTKERARQGNEAGRMPKTYPRHSTGV